LGEERGSIEVWVVGKFSLKRTLVLHERMTDVGVVRGGREKIWLGRPRNMNFLEAVTQ